MAWIVVFPGVWFLRETVRGKGRWAVAAGDPDRATRYPTEAEARAALQANKKFFKRASVKAAKFVNEEEE